jgi:hypothetical protein
MGCASTEELYKTGGLEHSMSSGMSFDHQYQITTKIKKENSTSLFPINYDKEIPKNTVLLRCYLRIVNPHKLDFTLRKNVSIINLEEDIPVILKKQMLTKPQQLPEDVTYISNLPLYTEYDSQVIFSIDVFSSGEKIYSTAEVSYKIGSKKN